MKDNYHRDLHHQLTTGKISSDEYSRKIEKFNREAMRKMLRQNLAKNIKAKK